MFSIDLTSRVPIYEQIHDKIIALIMNGTLSENDQLPSVRSLAKSVSGARAQRDHLLCPRTRQLYFKKGQSCFPEGCSG